MTRAERKALAAAWRELARLAERRLGRDRILYLCNVLAASRNRAIRTETSAIHGAIRTDLDGHLTLFLHGNLIPEDHAAKPLYCLMNAAGIEAGCLP